MLAALPCCCEFAGHTSIKASVDGDVMMAHVSSSSNQPAHVILVVTMMTANCCMIGVYAYCIYVSVSSFTGGIMQHQESC